MKVVFEDIRERLGVIDGWRAICGDEVERLERVLVEIWWFTFDHLCVAVGDMPVVETSAD